jgi:hypothetical protein
MAGTTTRIPVTISTGRMTAEQLARVWADHFGYQAKAGGWIYDDRGRPVVQGWDGFVRRLVVRAYIQPGTGVNWRAVDVAKARGGWRP